MPFSSTANYCKQNWGKTTWTIILLNKHFQTMTPQMFLSPALQFLKLPLTLNLKQIFWKTKSFFKKLEYRFLSGRLKTQHFHTKLPCQKLMRQIEWAVQNRPIMKNGVLPITTFFENFVFVQETHIKSWFAVPTDQISIFILSVSAGVFFEGAFGL